MKRAPYCLSEVFSYLQHLLFPTRAQGGSCDSLSLFRKKVAVCARNRRFPPIHALLHSSARSSSNVFPVKSKFLAVLRWNPTLYVCQNHRFTRLAVIASRSDVALRPYLPRELTSAGTAMLSPPGVCVSLTRSSTNFAGSSHFATSSNRSIVSASKASISLQGHSVKKTGFFKRSKLVAFQGVQQYFSQEAISSSNYPDGSVLSSNHLKPQVSPCLEEKEAEYLESSSLQKPTANVVLPSEFLSFPFSRELQSAILKLNLVSLTEIQRISIPKILDEKSLTILAATGSGKTLSYALPLVQLIRSGDVHGLSPYPHQPQALVLAPSRELALQILRVFRSLPTVSMVSAAGLSYTKQVESLRRGAEVVVSTPAHLLLHLKKRNLSLSRLKHLVLDEADILCDPLNQWDLLEVLYRCYNMGYALERGCAEDTASQRLSQDKLALAELNRSFSGKNSAKEASTYSAKLRNDEVGLDAFHLSNKQATHSERRRHLYGSIHSSFDDSLDNIKAEKGRKLAWRKPRGDVATSLRGKAIEPLAENKKLQLLLVLATHTGSIKDFISQALPRIQLEHLIDKSSHKPVSAVRQTFLALNGEDKLTKLLHVLEERNALGNGKTIVFCNTVRSCRAVDWHLNENGMKASSLHGEMPMKIRQKSFNAFKSGINPILVATNVASRGLHLPEIRHVVMFDFPFSLSDYLHRAGRTARAGESGEITAFFGNRNIPTLLKIQAASSDRNKPKIEDVKSGKIKQLLGLQSKWNELLSHKNMKRKIGGRRAKGLPPRRNLVGPEGRYHLKKMHLRLKAENEAKMLRKRGILGKNELLPRHPDKYLEISDAQETPTMIRSLDGNLQIINKRRKSYKNNKPVGRQPAYEAISEAVPVAEAAEFLREADLQKNTYLQQKLAKRGKESAF